MGPRAIEIATDVYMVGGRGLTAPEDAAVYLVAAGGEAALVDAGCGRANDLLLANVEAAGVDPASVRQLLLTHCHFDHTGGAAALRRRLGCCTVAHALDAGTIEAGDDVVSAASWYGSHLTPCPIDRRLGAAEEDLAIGGQTIRAYHIPGHSPGSLAFVWTSAGTRILFGQDVHGPLDDALRSDPVQYQASLRKLLALDADVLCEGHYGVVAGRERVAAFIRGFLAAPAI
jgi:glyoxylase-like metal-dependent hydrolase (beta-lactamase superfamily II)